MSYIGRRIQVGVGIEKTGVNRGVAVPAQARQPKTDFSFEQKAEVVLDESSIGVIVDSRDGYVTKTRGEGDVSGNFEINKIGYFLLSALGKNTTTAGTGTSDKSYNHKFEMDNTNQRPSLTLALRDPVLGDKAYPLTVVDTLTISANEGEPVTFTSGIKSKKEATAVHSAPTYTADHKLLARHSTFKIAVNKAGLSGATGICLKSFELNIENNLVDDYCMGSVEPNDFVNTIFNVSGSFTAKFENTDQRDAFFAGTHKAIEFTLKDTNTVIGLSDNPTVVITLPKVIFDDYSRDQGNDAIVEQTVNFKGLYDTTDGVLEITLKNTQATYLAA